MVRYLHKRRGFACDGFFVSHLTFGQLINVATRFAYYMVVMPVAAHLVPDLVVPKAHYADDPHARESLNIPIYRYQICLRHALVNFVDGKRRMCLIEYA